MTDYLADLQQAHKDRQARYAKAARGVEQPPRLLVKVADVTPEGQAARLAEAEERTAKAQDVQLHKRLRDRARRIMAKRYSIANREMSVEFIQRVTAEYFGMSLADMKTGGGLHGRRVRELSASRHIAMYLCRSDMGAAAILVGIKFNRDHSVVLQYSRRVAEECGDFRYTPAGSEPLFAINEETIAHVEAIRRKMAE